MGFSRLIFQNAKSHDVIQTTNISRDDDQPKGQLGVDDEVQDANNVNAKSSSRYCCCWNPENGCVDCCFALTFTFCRLRRVPISHRLQMVTSSDRLQNMLGSRPENLFDSFLSNWEEAKEQPAGKILGPDNPISVQVQLILTKIIQALHDTLGLQHDSHVSVYAPREGLPAESDSQVCAASLVSKRTRLIGSKDESNNCKTSFKCSKKWLLRKLGFRPGSREYLDGLNWEVMVVDSYEDNAFYLTMGKIVYFTGTRFHISEEKIAVSLGHEVGHGVGRHGSEDFLVSLMLLPSHLISAYTSFRYVETHAKAIRMFLRRRQELEADYIGMMLMASAGYDPRYAAQSYENYPGDIRSTHPSGRKRGKMLNKTKAMEKAMALYEQAQAGRT